MTELELAELMIERRKVAQRAAEIDEQIVGAVLALEETQKMAGVTATYYKESRKVDWEELVKYLEIPQRLVDAHTKTRKVTAWAKVHELYLNANESAYADPGFLITAFEEYSETKPARVAIKVKL